MKNTNTLILWNAITALPDACLIEADGEAVRSRRRVMTPRRWVAAAAAVALAVGLTVWGVTRRPQAPAVLPSEDTTAAVSAPLPSQTASLPAVPVPASDASASEPLQTASPAPSTTPVPSVTSVPAPVSEPVSEPVGGSVSTSPSEPDGASAPSAVSGTPDPVGSAPSVTPPVQFSPPPVQTAFTHSESTAKALAAWVMSDAALTEKNGAFREAVEFYRSLGKLPLIGLQQNELPVRWVLMRSTGELEIWFPENASNDPQYIQITPFNSSYSEKTLEHGIQLYFEAEDTFLPIKDSSQTPQVYFDEKPKSDVPDGIPSAMVIIAGSRSIDHLNRNTLYVLTSFQIDNIMYYTRDIYWEQNGFILHCKFTPCTSADEPVDSNNILTSIQLENISLK